MLSFNLKSLYSCKKSVAFDFVVGSRLKDAEILFISSCSAGLSFEFITRPPKALNLYKYFIY